MQNKNCLKIILHEYKLEQNSVLSEYGSFYISISFNSKTVTTDKININSSPKFKSGNIFNFDIPEQISEKQSIVINSIGTSWMLFNTVICSCEINYINNLSNFNNIKSWYSMKNKENKEMMKILISISILDLNNYKNDQENIKYFDIPMFNTKNSFINNSTITNKSFIENKELVSKKLNTSIISKTQRYKMKEKNSNPNIFSNDLFLHLYHNTNDSSIIPENKSIKNNNYPKENNCNIPNEEIKYNNTENKSCLLNEKYINFLDDNKNDENTDLNKIMSLIDKYEKGGGNKNKVKQFMEKINLIKEKETNLEKEKEIYNENMKKLKEKNKILDKERKSFEKKLSRFNEEKKEFESKNLNLIKFINEYEKEKNNFYNKQKIEMNNKEIFYNLNYYIATGNNIPLSDDKNCFSNNYKNNIYLSNNNNELIDSLNLDNEYL